jgi:hypothetical protein
MIQPSKKDETATLLSLTEAIGFEPSETNEIAQTLNRHFGDEANSRDIWLTQFDQNAEQPEDTPKSTRMLSNQKIRQKALLAWRTLLPNA